MFKGSAKVLRHFPLIPRLQRLFMSSNTASYMTWHAQGRANNDLMRHPADSLSWKTFDSLHPTFASEHRNVRLGLSSDGFNPFSSMSIAYSTWPVVLIPYNLPPWMCMKQQFFMLSLLIPSPNAPGNDIDVYLQPLVDELQELWEHGVTTYDVASKQNFSMHATLLWTISDFPAYANLSGWSTKGRFACPCCNKETCSYRLQHGKKFSYMGHRRFLKTNHRFRHDKRSFNGKAELRLAPTRLSGVDVLQQLEQLEPIILGRSLKRKRENVTHQHNWKKKSIFFQLPYWKTLLLRHNLDIMHIEKSVCDSIIGTLLNIEGKTKDNLNSRLDLQAMGIRKQLHPIEMGNKFILPTACYLLTVDEKKEFCKILKSIKVPDGYSSNISRCVQLNEKKVYGIKSHDCHVLMQQLLPLAIRGVFA